MAGGGLKVGGGGGGRVETCLTPKGGGQHTSRQEANTMGKHHQEEMNMKNKAKAKTIRKSIKECTRGWRP